MPDRINCPALVRLVTDYIEGAMPSEDVVRFDEHLQRCPPCEVYLTQMRRTIEICGTLPEETMTDEVRMTLMAAFEDWKVAR